MDERIEKWLYDIRFCVEEIESFLENTEKTYACFKQNLMLKRAIERNLVIHFYDNANKNAERTTIDKPFLDLLKIQYYMEWLDIQNS